MASTMAVLCLLLFQQVATIELQQPLSSIDHPMENSEPLVILSRRRRSVLDSFIDEVVQNNPEFQNDPPPPIYLSPKPIEIGPIVSTCLEGMAQVEYTCAPCQPGTYLKDQRACEICPVLTYQPNSRALECLPCPTAGDRGSTLCPDCVWDCTNLQDGDYQACGTCDGYVTCSNEILENRPCPADLVWDDTRKQCLYLSTTCGNQTNVNVTIVGIGECIESCSGVFDGQYQACNTCTHHISCSGDNLIKQPCPSGLVWDDANKACLQQSTTCGNQTSTIDEGVPAGECVESCIDVPDGYYQACNTCSYYISCSGGNKLMLPCTPGLIWDDNEKICDWSSDTCTPGQNV